MAEFNDRLRGMRHEHRLKQSELADKIGVAKSTVSNWEKGDSYPSLSMAIRLADLFGCTLDQLAGRV